MVNYVMLIQVDEIKETEYTKQSQSKKVLTQVMPHGFVVSTDDGRVAYIKVGDKFYRGALGDDYPLDNFINFKFRTIEVKQTAIFDNPSPNYLGLNGKPRAA